jgi:type VI secretion system secreted protein Hcp
MKRSSLVTLLASFLYAGSLSAASDYLLEIDGVKGESKDDKHKESIEIQSFSWGVSNLGSSGGGAGKVSFQDLHFTAKVSKATPQLMLACATGKHIPSAILYVRKAGGSTNEYYKITLEEVLVSGLQQTGPGTNGGTSTDSTPSDNVVLYFNSMSVEHTADDGTVTTGRAVRTPAQ